MIIRIVVLLACVWIFAGCKFDYSKANLEESLDEDIPDIVLEDAQLIFVRGTEVTIYAKKIDIYSQKKQQDMTDITFSEVTPSGEIRLKGKADKISIETDNNNITMRGNIFARSFKDESEINTDYLYWNDETRTIEGSTITPVTVTKDIGSTISGIGFKGDVEKRELTISGGAEGQLVIDEEDEETQ